MDDEEVQRLIMNLIDGVIASRGPDNVNGLVLAGRLSFKNGELMDATIIDPNGPCPACGLPTPIWIDSPAGITCADCHDKSCSCGVASSRLN